MLCYTNFYVLSFDVDFSNGLSLEDAMENLWEKNWPEHRRQSLKVQMKDSSKYTVTVIAKRQQRFGYKTRTPVMQVMAAVLSSLLGCSLCTTFVPSFTLEEYLTQPSLHQRLSVLNHGELAREAKYIHVIEWNKFQCGKLPRVLKITLNGCWRYYTLCLSNLL